MRPKWGYVLFMLMFTVYMMGGEFGLIDRAAMQLSAYAENSELKIEISTAQESIVDAMDTMLQIDIIHSQRPAQDQGKKVLIYHTHTYEAYEQETERQYQQTEKWRTNDPEYNIISIGKALAACLQALGIEVEHDTTAFEPPTLDDAYSRSLLMLENRKANGERYDLYIDLHRDAVSSSSNLKRTVKIRGEDVARFMVLIGKGTTGGYTEVPNWEANYVIAQRITDCLNAQCESLARNVKVKTGRFNQHVDDCCVLIECGMNTNTQEEVLAGIPYLARAIADTLNDEISKTR